MAGWRPQWQALLLLAAVLASRERAAALAAALAVADAACGCGCCEASYRQPAMQINGAQLMCVRAQGSCPEQCRAGDMNAIAAFAAGGVVDTARYCLSDCAPASQDDVAAGCQELPESAVTVQAKGGSDPAEQLDQGAPELPPSLPPRVVVAEQEAAQAADEEAFQEAAVMAKVEKSDKDKIEQRDTESGVMVAQAAGRRAQAAALDARASGAEAQSATAVLKSTAALRQARIDAATAIDAKAKLKASALRSSLYAKSAARSLQLAQEELQAIKDAPAQAARDAAAVASRRLAQQARQWDAELAAETAAMQLPAAPAAQQRTEEAFYAAAQRDIQRRSQANHQGQELLQQEAAVERNARALRGQAAQQALVGEHRYSQQLVGSAESLERQASQWDSAATKVFEKVGQLDLEIAAYARAAEAAAAVPQLPAGLAGAPGLAGPGLR